MYELSSWARGTAVRPDAAAGGQAGGADGLARRRAGALYPAAAFHQVQQPPPASDFFRCASCLTCADEMLRGYDRHHCQIACARALSATPRTGCSSIRKPTAHGAAFEPCYLLSTMALKGLGYRNDHPVIEEGARGEPRVDLGSGRSRALTSPAFRPTGIPRWPPRRCSIRASAATHPALRESAKWLIDHQIFKKGDWSVKRPEPRTRRMGLRVLQRLVSRR